MKNILAPSILSADFKILGEQLKLTEEAGAEYIHFDVMDGMFVPSISFGMPVLASIKGATTQTLDVHLMVTEPIRYVEEFVKAGADIVTVHYEACEDLQATIDKIHAAGAKVGISIKPKTDIEVDGGIYHKNVAEVLAAGANVMVSGSGVFKGDIKDNTAKFMEILNGNV